MDAKEITVFIAYSRLDIDYLIDLKKFLSPLVRNKSIATWYDGEIVPGEVWEDEIKQALHSAEIFLLLVSADSLASDYFYDKEVNNAMERHLKGESIVVPVVLKPCGWGETQLANLQALPHNGKALTTWANKDEAYQSIYDGLKSVIKKIQDKKSLKEKKEKPAIDERGKNNNSNIHQADTPQPITKSSQDEISNIVSDSKELIISNDNSKKKILTYLVIGIIIIAAISSALISNNKNKQDDMPRKIGDRCNGGIVFYIDSTSRHGLIAAPFDQSKEAFWGCFGTNISGAQGSDIGTGQQNTEAILEACPEEGIAARLCSDLNLDGYEDWYLPSYQELRNLWESREIVGGFSKDQIYWSSTQDGSADRVSILFFNSECTGTINNKGGKFYVRAIRSF